MTMKHKKIRLLLPVLGWLLILSSPALALDPCALVTKAEVEKIMGEEVSGPFPAQVTGMTAGVRCSYKTAAPLAQRGRVGTLQVVVYDQETMAQGVLFKSPREYFAKNRRALEKSSKNLRDVPGLADQAFWLSGPDTLHLLAGEYYLQLQVKDMVQMKAKTMSDLSQKVSAHRLELSIRIARDFLLPRLKAR
jgi:hypothetical protein